MRNLTRSFSYILICLGLLSQISVISSQTVVNFNYTGAPQNWVVPSCVTSITVVVRGAQGGGTNGGLGAEVTGTMAVTPGQTLQINVGGQGGCPTGGWNGGGTGATASGFGNESCGGGGGSDIRFTPYALTDRQVVAAGGGGMGGGDTEAQGGMGGCVNGADGTSPFGQGGFGATQFAGGLGGPPWIPSGNYGTDGGLGIGGNGGSDPCYNLGPGAGGGGGYYGGGGGGSDCYDLSPLGGGGGGGGSCLTIGGGCTDGSNTGNGFVSITYTGGGAVFAVGNTGPYCQGDTVQLTSGSGGTSYVWSGPSSFNDTVQNPIIPHASTANGGVYTVTITDAGGCTSTYTTNVTVNIGPIVNPGYNSPLCEGQNLQLTSSGGVLYNWSGPGGFTSTWQNPIIPNVTMADSGFYTVIVTGANGCETAATINVVITSGFNLTASSNAPLCIGDTLNLNASNGGVSYTWNGPGGFNSSSQNPTIPSVQVSESGTYIVTSTNSGGCQGTDTVVVLIDTPPNAVATNDGPICENEAFGLVGTGGNDYAWSGPNGFISLMQNPTITNAPASAGGVYTVIVTSPNGCTVTATTTVIVNPYPNIVTNTNSPACAGGVLNIGATGGQTYQWTGPGGFSSSLQNLVIDPATSAASGTYSITVADSIGCESTITIDIVVNPSPDISFEYTAHCFNAVSFNSLSTGGTEPYTVGWDLNNDGVVDMTAASFDFTFADSVDQYVTATVTDANGCTDSTGMLVNIKGGVLTPDLPNVLIHNSTVGNNAYDFAMFAPGFNECFDYVFSVYDRWGVLVFETENSIGSPDLTCDHCFRGKTGTGEPVTPGVYFFVLKGSPDVHVNGTINVFE